MKHPSENGSSVSRCESGELRREVWVRQTYGSVSMEVLVIAMRQDDGTQRVTVIEES